VGFFCTRIYYLKQASQALVNVTDMSSFVVAFDFEEAESLKPNFVFKRNYFFFFSFSFNETSQI